MSLRPSRSIPDVRPAESGGDLIPESSEEHHVQKASQFPPAFPDRGHRLAPVRLRRDQAGDPEEHPGAGANERSRPAHGIPLSKVSDGKRTPHDRRGAPRRPPAARGSSFVRLTPVGVVVRSTGQAARGQRMRKTLGRASQSIRYRPPGSPRSAAIPPLRSSQIGRSWLPVTSRATRSDRVGLWPTIIR
jgi:hypothetical protein